VVERLSVISEWQRSTSCYKLSAHIVLSVCYKLLEHTILQRISPTVEDLLIVDRAGFHRGCSICDQVPAVTTFTENGFEKTLKTSAVFLDLTAAYDTI